MHLSCPHCHNLIEVVELAEELSPLLVKCPSCGSQWKVEDVGNETQLDSTVRMVGRFCLLTMLGSGHFGAVWSAFDPVLDKKVAIKLPRKGDMDKEDIERFLREARSAAQLRHPNIVGIHDVGKDGDRMYIVSDLIEGANLADWIHARKLQSFEEMAALCENLADALQHAHDQGVIHRDLKPANVLMDGNRKPFLTDFGLAKRESGEITMTIEGRILGTPAYMPPEQAGGDGHNADCRSDVYSLGVLLFEVLTGQRPFKGNSRLLLHQVMHEDPCPPRRLNSKIPKDLQTICLKAMEKSPERRYATAREMAEELRRYRQGQPILTRPISQFERSWRWARRNPILAGLEGALAVFVILFGIVSAENIRHRVNNAPVLRTVTIDTVPAATELVFVPVSNETGVADSKGKVVARTSTGSTATVRLEPGMYLVIANRRNHGFHEVYRSVPKGGNLAPEAYPHKKWTEEPNGTVTLPAISIPKLLDSTVGMARLEGGEIALELPDEVVNPKSDPEQREATLRISRDLKQKFPPASSSPNVPVEPYFLDATEMTVQQCRRLSESGNSLPSELQSQESNSENHAIAEISYDRAVMYAELAGKRLPTEEEYLFAATFGGTRKYPWGDDGQRIESWTLDDVKEPDFDHIPTVPPVFGLYSNVAEWTSSWHTYLPSEPRVPMDATFLENLAQSRVVRGGPYGVVRQNADSTDWKLGPKIRFMVPVGTRERGLGFRCARSTRPRFLD